MSDEISRRQFLRWLPNRAAVKKEAVQETKKEEKVIRPPGAIKIEKEFLNTCEKCQACAEACPHDVISFLGPLSGEAEGTPFLNPTEKACYWCSDFPCIDKCPSGALSFNDDKVVEPIAKVIFDEESCLIKQGTICDDCVMWCPSSVQAITMNRMSIVYDQDKCVGCGLCVKICPTNPKSFRFEVDDDLSAEPTEE